MHNKEGKVADICIISLEWDGHDFLDAARDNEIWNKVKKKILATGGVLY